MRRLGVDLLDRANDLLQLAHQLGAVLQPAGGVDQQHVGVDLDSDGEGKSDVHARRIVLQLELLELLELRELDDVVVARAGLAWR